MDLSDYDAASSTIMTRTLTSDEINRNILSRLMRDDPELSRLDLSNSSIRGDDDEDYSYYPSSTVDLCWLGYFIGRSSHLTQINFVLLPGDDLNFSKEQMLSFARGFNENKSIENIELTGYAHSDWFQLLGPFFHKNESLRVLDIDNCTFGPDSVRQLSSLLETVELTGLNLVDLTLGDEDLVRIFDAVKRQTGMKDLSLPGTTMGRRAQRKLSTIVRDYLPELDVLILTDTGIANDFIERLARVLTERSPLRKIDFSSNPVLTDRGYQAITTMIESPNCSLRCLALGYSNVTDDLVISFANAMANNKSLERLHLYGNPDISARGWEKMSRVLCDTSSANKTFLSNHTLCDLGMEYSDMNIPAELASLLEANKSKDKANVRVNKILAHHADFSTPDFFEFGLKMLPLVVGWLERAADRPRDFDAKFPTRKLSAVYQFLRNSPCLVGQSLEYDGRREQRRRRRQPPSLGSGRPWARRLRPRRASASNFRV